MFKELRLNWKRQGILNENTIGIEEKLTRFVKEHTIYLPTRFVEYLCEFNGMSNATLDSFDENCFLFYPIEELIVIDISGLFRKKHKGRYIVFADYMHSSWWYALRLETKEKPYSIGLMPSKSKFIPITGDWNQFLSLYLNNSSKLYPAIK